MRVSVVITAYKRKEYLPYAIQSVLNQNIDKSMFEIIVVSNFYVDVSRFGQNSKIRTILMDGDMGEYLFTGLSIAKYDIIAFLDDDDTFDSGKLMRLMEIFSANRQLCYYHNDVKYVDRSGHKIDYIRLVEKSSQTLNGKSLIFGAKSNPRAIKVALENRGDFNLSSITIRRDCYLKYLLQLKQIKGNPEGFFFWTGIIGMGQLMVDNEKLTNYRVHDMNESGPLNFISKAQVVQRQIYTYDLILNFLEKNPAPYKITEEPKKWIFLLKYEYELMSAIFTNSSRVSILMQIRRLLTIGVKYSNTLKFRVLLFSCIAIINHDFAQRLYIKMRTRKHKN